MKRIFTNDWRVILAALNMVAAGPWDEASYGPRPDFERVIDKVAERLGGGKELP
jgi:hypothetical protein